MHERMSLEAVPRIDVDEAHRLVESGESIVFVDVREREPYDESHIRESISLPLKDFPRSYAELPRDVLIVTY
ncbi:MAG: hypothetical protein EPO21_11920 [Chloroflexota bacterium]|nr:MAG: hypothetical protein EPO21_11920 [Chloroflexota bacterium]